ncbi:MAG: aminoacyl-tRNA hydrolase [bacterium]|nr:aminoacyl-tRNA hydrolase [bacterium]MDZ4285683.1 aminoacyl-tRNA hydrolase [Candidatus Sungbacteria bacterium]
MYLIIGLGNPGDEYANTRHNIGREAVETFRKAQDFPAFRFEKKWNAEISEGKIGKEKFLLALPDTFMNKSGLAAGALSRFYKVKPATTIVIHDDADIALGSAKMSFAKRSAGHKGVESIIRNLKTNEFWRFRLGIAGKRDIPAEKIVLRRFTPDEQRVVKKVIKQTLAALQQTITQGPERAMNEYNS